MPYKIDPLKYHKSITQELKAVQNRVRSLIGAANWGQDGNYKEVVLRNVIKRYLANDLTIGTGFIVDETGGNLTVSNQIDILIVKRDYPCLFTEGDFIITTPFNVKAIIEVKTNFSPYNIDVIKKSTENANITRSDIFNGIFSFENTNYNFDNREFEIALRESRGKVDHICFGENFFVKYWYQNSSFPVQNAYRFYNIKNLAFTYFISNLVNYLYGNTRVERNWFLFPLINGKEGYGFKDLYINE